MASELTLHFYPAGHDVTQARNDGLVFKKNITTEQKLGSITLVYEKENFHILFNEILYPLGETDAFYLDDLIMKVQTQIKQIAIAQQTVEEHLLDLMHIDNDDFSQNSTDIKYEVYANNRLTELAFLTSNDLNSYCIDKNEFESIFQKKEDKTIKNLSLLTEYYEGPKVMNDCKK